MITRTPQVGDRIEYNEQAPKGFGTWKPAGVIVGVVGNLAYTCDPNSSLTHKQYFGGSPVPAGCETANNGFIWRFHDTNNKMHRIVE